MKNAMNELARRGYINRLSIMRVGYGDGEGGEGGEGGDKGGEGDKGKKDGEGGADDKGGEGGDKGKKPTDEEARLLKENMKKKDEIARIKAEKEQLNTALNDLKKKVEGVDLDKIREMLAKQQDDETKALEAKGEFDKVKQQMKDAHAKERADLEKKIGEYADVLRGKDSVIEELTVGSSFSSSSFIKDGTTMSPKIARTIFGAHFDVAEGKTVGYDKPRGAKDRAPLVDGDGNPLAFDQALEALVKGHEDSVILLKAKGKPGTGSGSSGSGKGDKGDKGEPQLVGRERIAAALGSQKKK
jgi:hypothetical protein